MENALHVLAGLDVIWDKSAISRTYGVSFRFIPCASNRAHATYAVTGELFE